MRILVAERTSETQAATARRLDAIERVDKDILDLSLALSDEKTIIEKLNECDVLLLGASLGEQSVTIAETAKSAFPEVEILMFLPRDTYLSGGFRTALSHGVRKVLCEDATSLDIVQELMSIKESFRSKGKMRQGRVVAVAQAKGGVGATSTCAALAEVCEAHGQRILLWDLDIETRDLCRSAMTPGEQPSIVRELFTGERELSRENLRQAAIPVSPRTAVLPPPDQIAASLDFVGHVEAMDLAQALVALARHTYDTVIIDLGSRFSPAAGAIMQAADSVIVMVDDTILGLSAVRAFIPTLQSVVRGDNSIQFLCSGISVSKDELARHVLQEKDITEHAWSLPVIPFDPAASRWPGTGKTLYTLGKKQTRRALEELACSLKMIDSIDSEERILTAGDNALRACACSVSLLGLACTLSYPLRIFWQRVVSP